MTLRVAVIITTQLGKAHEQIAAFALIADAVRAEPGCLRYDLHQVTNESEKFLLLEEWESAQALAAHDDSALMAEASERHATFRAGPAEVLELSAAL